ncbi:hypothetical protein NPIL_456991 [Nephila pilipes]|uniref:Uncharacterized protein n=1 Tax=Nephila pilipes TaxID=299642 RepID=A0A8X6QBN8_NEPPI|nr:hypothetical protein NPIL_456991 [Nephila pilipes]
MKPLIVHWSLELLISLVNQTDTPSFPARSVWGVDLISFPRLRKQKCPTAHLTIIGWSSDLITVSMECDRVTVHCKSQRKVLLLKVLHLRKFSLSSAVPNCLEWSKAGNVNTLPLRSGSMILRFANVLNYLPNDTLTEITNEEDLLALSNQIAISSEDEDIGAMNDDNMEVDLDNSSEDFEVITVVVKDFNTAIVEANGAQDIATGKKNQKLFVIPNVTAALSAKNDC